MVTYRARGNKGGRTEGNNKMFRVFYVRQSKTGPTPLTVFLDIAISPANELVEFV